MKAEVVEFENITDIDAIRALQPAWDALWHTAQGVCYQSFTFCLGSWETGVSTPGGKIHCVAGRKNGRLVVLLPCVTFRNFLWRFVRLLAPENGSPNGILVEPGPDAVNLSKAAWRAMLKYTKADVVEVRRIRYDSPLYLCATGGGWIMNTDEETTPIVPLRQYSNWDDFRALCTGRSRSSPDYLFRRLGNHGKVEVMIVGAGDDRIAYFIDWLLLHKRDWAVRMGLNSPSIFAAETRDFLIAQFMAPEGYAQPFRLVVLTLNGRPLAISLLAVTASCADLFMNTYDASFSKLSPGTALVDYCVKWAFDHHLDFDFGSGLQQYKCFWSNGASYNTVSLRVAQTRWGFAGCTLKAALTRVRERARQLRASDTSRTGETPAPEDNGRQGQTQA